MSSRQTYLIRFYDQRGLESNLSLISIAFDGIITDQITASSDLLLGQTSQVFDSSFITQDKIAYVRQSGEIGDYCKYFTN